jgi:hypothetical protein
MAVRDEERQAITVERAWRGMPWRDAFGVLAPILALGAIVLYAYLAICYDRFYRNLGVDPADVGLSYTSTLARSPGFVVVYLVTCVVAVVAAVGWWKVEYRDAIAKREPFARLAFGTIVFLAAGAVIFALTEPYIAAGQAATNVRAGTAVMPVRAPNHTVNLPFPLLTIHADPATVEPVGKPQEAPAAERLRNRKLLYLGQAEGTMVLYDSAVQQAVYVPVGSVILHLTNCRAKPPPDPSCEHVFQQMDPKGQAQPGKVGRPPGSR